MKKSIPARVFTAAISCCPSSADNSYCFAGLVMQPGSLTGFFCDPFAACAQPLLSICFAFLQTLSLGGLGEGFSDSAPNKKRFLLHEGLLF